MTDKGKKGSDDSGKKGSWRTPHSARDHDRKLDMIKENQAKKIVNDVERGSGGLEKNDPKN